MKNALSLYEAFCIFAISVSFWEELSRGETLKKQTQNLK